MAAVRTVTITAGIPTAGSGTVSTIDTLAATQFGTVTTLTRPADTTPYTALDSISNNSSPGSVTALVATVSDTNDDPVIVEAILLDTTDTGLGGTNVRAYLFNSDPTASSGVVAGDNQAWSNKKAGLVGTLTGKLFACNDGARGRLAPEYGQSIRTQPATGAKTLWVQYQTVDGFSPSANSTTLSGTIIARQGRA